jgi:hypothetical protein
MTGAMRCPFCLSPAPADAAICAVPACGRPLVDERGTRLRIVDARFEATVAEEERLYRLLLVRGTAIALGVLLLAPALHLAATPLLAAPLLAAFHLVLVRFTLLAPARPLLSGLRRSTTRWVTRAVFLVVGTVGYGFTAVPVAGAAVGAGVFAGLTTFAHLFSLRALRQEKERVPLARWEKALFVTLLALVALATVVAVLLAWKLSALAAELFHRIHR